MKEGTEGFAPAFPIRDMNEHPGPIGLTIRDYFLASSGVTWSDAVTVATDGGKVVRTGPEIAEMLACMRGNVADAMLAERAK